MPSDRDIVACRGVTVDLGRGRATFRGRELNLRPAEMKLLATLVRDAGRAFSRKELMVQALGEDTLVLERTIDVHVHSLRKELGTSADLIETVRDIGYRFRAETK